MPRLEAGGELLDCCLCLGVRDCKCWTAVLVVGALCHRGPHTQRHPGASARSVTGDASQPANEGTPVRWRGRGPVRGIVAYDLELRTTVAARFGPWLGSALSQRGIDLEWSALRKVHHPKIVQRADRLWIVVCDDCERDHQSATPIGINTPVESREMAQRLWENHSERRGAFPMRRGA